MRYGTAADIKVLTGIGFADLGLDNDVALDAAIDTWLDQVSSMANALLKSRAPVSVDDPDYSGVLGAVERTVSNIVAYATQARNTPLVSVDEYSRNVIDASDATKHLKRELSAYLDSSVRVGIFTSIPQETE